MGGLPGGPIDNSEHELTFWEKKVDALLMLLTARKLVRVDAMRRSIENLPPDAYDKMGYYERWMSAITDLLLTRGVLTTDELGRKMAEVEMREAESRGRG